MASDWWRVGPLLFGSGFHDLGELPVDRQLGPELPLLEGPVSLIERLLGEESRSIELAFQGRSQLEILGPELRPEVVPIFGDDVVQGSDGMKTHETRDSSEVTRTDPGPYHSCATAPSGVKPMTNCRSKAASVSSRLAGLSPVFTG